MNTTLPEGFKCGGFCIYFYDGFAGHILPGRRVKIFDPGELMMILNIIIQVRSDDSFYLILTLPLDNNLVVRF